MVIPIMFGNSEVTYYSSCKICLRVSFLFTQINLKPVHISCVSLAQNPQFYPPPHGFVFYIVYLFIYLFIYFSSIYLFYKPFILYYKIEELKMLFVELNIRLQE